MKNFDKVSITNNEVEVIKILWNEIPSTERKNIFDITNLGDAQETIKSLINKIFNK